jgi:hypothetical protein
MKKRIIFSLLFLFVGIVAANAQSHSYKYVEGCRYAKNDPKLKGVRGEKDCPACTKEREDERKAKQVEDKRRLEIVAAAQKAKEEIDKAAALAKQEAEIKARKTEPVKITIDMPTEDKNKKKMTAVSQTGNANISVTEKLYAKKDDATGKYGYFSLKDPTKWIIEPKFGNNKYEDYAADFEGAFARVIGNFAANGAALKEQECKCSAVGHNTQYDKFLWHNVIDRSGKLLFDNHNKGDMFVLIEGVPFTIKLNITERFAKWSCSAELYNLSTIKSITKLENNTFNAGYNNECMKHLFYFDTFNYFYKEKLDTKVLYKNRSGYEKEVPPEKIEKLKEVFSKSKYTRLITYCTGLDNKTYPIVGFLLGPNGEFSIIDDAWLQGLY